MDQQILATCSASATKAARVLGLIATSGEVDSPRARGSRPNQTGSAGQLQEWLEDWDIQAPERDHRHVSISSASFRGTTSTPAAPPGPGRRGSALAELRGDQATGWATAWRINLWARLG
jgi:alpha-L-fucosidase 2